MKSSAPETARSAISTGALCPSCERFIGPADACPYCGADSARRPLLRHLRHAALALAVAGLAGLLAVAARSEPPAVKIGEITPTMNFAYVRVTGSILSEPKVLRDGNNVDFISLTLGDGTGQLRLLADGPVALALSLSPGVPAKGTRIEAAGTLSVSSEGQPRLRLQTSRHLRVVGPERPATPAKPGGDES